MVGRETLRMGRSIAAAIAIACLSSLPFAPCARGAAGETHFEPAHAISVSDVAVPIQSLANGTVVLNVTVSEKGEVGDVQARRDIASITEQAIRSIKTWKFAPARLNGNAVASIVTVAVTFNPVPPLSANVPLPPLVQQSERAPIHLDFHPAGVTQATFPTYPVTALNPGTVILEASINEAGRVHQTSVLRDAPPFTASALRAVGDWRFISANLNGMPVESKVVLVFCFRQSVTY